MTSGTNAVPGASYRPTDPNKVQVLYQPPSRPYEVIGFVSVDKTIGVEDKDVARKFRQAAAKLGAQAVIVEVLRPIAHHPLRLLQRLAGSCQSGLENAM